MTTGQRLAAFFDKKIAQLYLSGGRHQPDSAFANLTEAMKDRPALAAMAAAGVVAAATAAMIVSPQIGLFALGGSVGAGAKMLVGLYGMVFTGKMLNKANATRHALPEELAEREARAARPKREWRYFVDGDTLMTVSAETDPGRVPEGELKGRINTQHIVQQAISDSLAREFADQSVAQAGKPGSWGRAALYILTPAAMTAVFGPLPVALGAARWYAGLRQDSEELHRRVTAREAALAGTAPAVSGQDMGPANPGAKADWRYLARKR